MSDLDLDALAADLADFAPPEKKGGGQLSKRE